jgi:hypothetical protein
MKCIASTNLVSENSSTGMGGGPTPLACTRSPQKGWSPKKGTMVVGHYIHERRRIKKKDIKDRIQKSTIQTSRSYYRSFKTSSCCSSTSMMNLQQSAS